MWWLFILLLLLYIGYKNSKNPVYIEKLKKGKKEIEETGNNVSAINVDRLLDDISFNKKSKGNTSIIKVLSHTIVQLLESVHIVETTNKYDVFKSSLRFIHSISDQAFKIISHRNKFIRDKGIEEYKKRYFNRTLSNLQSSVLEKPYQLKISEFYKKETVAFYCRFCELKSNEIHSLKSEVAKSRRIIEIEDVSKAILDELDSAGDEQYISQLIEYREQYTKMST